MIERRTVFEMHRLAQEGFSVRKIAARLGVSRQSVQKYLDDPHPPRPRITRASKLDPFKDDIAGLLEIDPKVSAAVIRQRLQERGFDGQDISIKSRSSCCPRPGLMRLYSPLMPPYGRHTSGAHQAALGTRSSLQNVDRQNQGSNYQSTGQSDRFPQTLYRELRAAEDRAAQA